MSILMKGADVAKTMKEDLTGEARRLKDRGILPSLTIVRVGARPDDLAYERGSQKADGDDRDRVQGSRIARNDYPG